MSSNFQGEIITVENYRDKLHEATAVIENASQRNQTATTAAIIFKVLTVYNEAANDIRDVLRRNLPQLINLVAKAGILDRFEDNMNDKDLMRAWRHYRNKCRRIINKMGWTEDEDLGMEINDEIAIDVSISNPAVSADITGLNLAFRQEIAAKTNRNVEDLGRGQTYDDDFYDDLFLAMGSLRDLGVPIPKRMTKATTSNNPRYVNAIMGAAATGHHNVAEMHDELMKMANPSAPVQRYRQSFGRVIAGNNKMAFLTNHYGQNPALTLIAWLLDLRIDAGRIPDVIGKLYIVLRSQGPSQQSGRAAMVGAADPDISLIGRNLVQQVEIYDPPKKMNYSRLRDCVSIFHPLPSVIGALFSSPERQLLLSAWIWKVENHIVKPEKHTSFKMIARSQARGFVGPLKQTSNVKQNRYLVKWTVQEGRPDRFKVVVRRSGGRLALTGHVSSGDDDDDDNNNQGSGNVPNPVDEVLYFENANQDHAPGDDDENEEEEFKRAVGESADAKAIHDAAQRRSGGGGGDRESNV